MVMWGHVSEKIERRRLERLVRGLRNGAPCSEVKVFKANDDGTRGEFLRIEPPYGMHDWRKFNRRYPC